MTRPIGMEPSPLPAVPRKEGAARLRILVVAGEGAGSAALLQSLRQWADDGRLEVDAAPDLPRAVRLLAGQRWDVVLAALGERPDEELAWWVDALRAATGGPRLIAAAQTPSMGLALRAEKLGVLDVLALPLRRDDLTRALERLRSAASEAAIPLPEVAHHAGGQYGRDGKSPAVLEAINLMARDTACTTSGTCQGG